MASYLEMDAVGRDRARFVSLAKQCLAFPDINEWERKFLDSLIRGNEMMGGPPNSSASARRRGCFRSAMNMSCIRSCMAGSHSDRRRDMERLRRLDR